MIHPITRRRISREKYEHEGGPLLEAVLWKQARKESGLAAFERTNHAVRKHGRSDGYDIPGTVLAGQHAMLIAHCNDIYGRLKAKAVRGRSCEVRTDENTGSL